MQTEKHPLQPFLPTGARLLMLGSFPPARYRWSMDFFYPNFQNDMWRIFGLCFHGDKMHFVCQERKTYDLDAIVDFLKEKGCREMQGYYFYKPMPVDDFEKLLQK